jgi:hypothetical protein
MSETIKHRGKSIQYDSASWLVTAVGLLLGSAGLAYVITHSAPMAAWVLELVLISIPAIAIVYGGYWIAAHQVPKEDRWSIAKWCLSGAVIAASLLFGYIGAEQMAGETVIDPELLVILGALGGALAALSSAISAERHHLNIAISTGDEYQLVTADIEPFSANAQAFTRLAVDTRSRYLIRSLQLAERPLDVESIADQIAIIEGTDTHEVYTDLIHNHLPKLADGNLIRYDSDDGMVQLGDQVATVANASEELSE